MEAFEMGTLRQEASAASRLYLEFLRRDALSAGLYVLSAGGVDPQQPHTEDEVYYIVSGAARIAVGSQDREVRPGSIVFVPAGVEHRFHSIEQDLAILVFFAPPEGSLGR